MVGTPRSSGCDICRKRKKKCDEGRPECRNCIISGWKCPGFSKRWKFVEENSQLISLYRKKKYTFEEEDLDDDDVSGRNGSQPQNLTPRDRCAPCQYDLSMDVCRPLISDQDRSATILSYILDYGKHQALFPLSSHGDFYKFIPSRLGRNLALDTSISCLCTIYTDTLSKYSPTSRDSIRSYARALSSLRACLETEHVRTESETICASIILQLCELLTNANNGRWNQLSKGSKLLIQECGPARFTSPFERIMLESQRAFFITQDLNAGESCFLAQPEWQKILQPSQTPRPKQSSSSLELRSELCDLLVEIPDLLIDTSNLWKINRSYTLDPDENSSLWNDLRLRATSLYKLINSWRSTGLISMLLAVNYPYTLPSSLESLDSDLYSKSTSDFEEQKLLLAVLDCVSNCALIGLQKLLVSLPPPASSHQIEDLSVSSCPTTEAERKAAVRAAFEFVHSLSFMSAKPLEFGLRQLLSPESFFNRTCSIQDSSTP